MPNIDYEQQTNGERFAEIIMNYSLMTNYTPKNRVAKIMRGIADAYGGKHISLWWSQLSPQSKRRYATVIANLYAYIVHDEIYEDAETDKYLLATYDAYLSMVNEKE